MANHANVTGSHYCNVNSSKIGVVNPVLPTSTSIFLVTDHNNDLIFRVNNTSSTFHRKRALVDASGATVVTLRNKHMTLHERWQAFKGDSKNKNDLIFNAKHSSLTDSSPDLNIYLAGNKDEKICDYRVDSSFIFYAGGSRINIIAEAKEHIVKVEPNVDIAFIASLIAILDGISEQEEQNRKMCKTLDKVNALVGAANDV